MVGVRATFPTALLILIRVIVLCVLAGVGHILGLMGLAVLLGDHYEVNVGPVQAKLSGMTAIDIDTDTLAT